MKRLLVPTDFSENAYKALVYACDLAKKTNVEVILLNSFQAPSSTANVMINFIDILEKDSKKDLEKLATQIRLEYPNIKFITFSAYGTLTEAIKRAENKFEIDLIVMGTAGASNVSSKIFGSNTTDVLKKADLPVLVVPIAAGFKPWKNITFATNLLEDKNDCPFEPLKKITSIADSNLNLLTVVDKDVVINLSEIEDRITPKLKGTNFTITIVENQSVVDGILNFINETPTDLLVMIRKNYGFIEKLFHTSVTKKVALSSNKPILLYKAC